MRPARIPKTGLPPKRTRPKREECKGYLDWIRSLPCPIYPGGTTEAHHLLRADPKRGMGRRADDRYAIPLSSKAHRELHANGNEDFYLASKGIDGRALAARLWSVFNTCAEPVRSEMGLRAILRARIVVNRSETPLTPDRKAEPHG